MFSHLTMMLHEHLTARIRHSKYVYQVLVNVTEGSRNLAYAD